MKISLDDLYIVPPAPRLAKVYAEAVRDSKDRILDWFDDEDHVENSVFEFSVNLLGMSQRSEYYPIFFVCTEDKILGFFNLSPVGDEIGAELSGWIRSGYEGDGLGPEIIRTACDQAFIGLGHSYVLMVIDTANTASNGAAKKAGFKLHTEINAAKSGRKGTGRMNVWVKINRYPGAIDSQISSN